MLEKIGENAGRIWHALNNAKTPLDLKTLRTQTKISTERDVLLAIGWLAKENKLSCTGTGRDAKISLK